MRLQRSDLLRVVRPVHGLLWPRWLFLRALGLIFFSAFYSLAFQIRGLIGTRGILPAASYLAEVSSAVPGAKHVWYVPSLFWLGAGDRTEMLVVWAGLLCSALIVGNIWPRWSIGLATVLFLSCVSVLQDFSSYQSDGMLLEAGVIAVFFAPGGMRPGLGGADPPSRFALFMLRWEWFRIYFESGVVKLASGDPHWRHLTAMDDYYQNGPLPAWPGWYVEQLPHGFHAATALLTLVIELVVVWAVFLPRRPRIACFLVVTALQVSIITTANYAFLNYLVLALGILLLDDRALSAVRFPAPRESEPVTPRAAFLVAETGMLAWMFYATVAAFTPGLTGVLSLPEHALAPFRIANAYGLFANMTPARFEIEFQGSRDGQSWIPYPFRYKPQDPKERPGIYAPYQPRFEWNLWFASLEPWRASPWVINAQARLIEGSPAVLALFRGDPFGGKPPPMVRTVLWRYWFTDLATKRRTGAWWRRQEMALFSGTLVRQSDGRMELRDAP